MHCVGGSISSAVPATNRTGEGVQLGMAGPDSSESSEPDSSESEMTGDEDGWDSGESSASLVVNHRQHHTFTHSSSRTHVTANPLPRLSLKETAKCLLSRGDKNRNSNRQSVAGANAKCASVFARPAPLDT